MRQLIRHLESRHAQQLGKALSDSNALAGAVVATGQYLEAAGSAFSVDIDGAGLWGVAHVAGAAARPVGVAAAAARPVARRKHPFRMTGRLEHTSHQGICSACRTFLQVLEVKMTQTTSQQQGSRVVPGRAAHQGGPGERLQWGRGRLREALRCRGHALGRRRPGRCRLH